MFAKGRLPNDISYKQEVLKKYPSAYWMSRYVKHQTWGAIMIGDKRVSTTERAPWKAWEDAWNRLVRHNEKPEDIKWTY